MKSAAGGGASLASLNHSLQDGTTSSQKPPWADKLAVTFFPPKSCSHVAYPFTPGFVVVCLKLLFTR